MSTPPSETPEGFDDDALAAAARIFDLARHGDAQELTHLLAAGLKPDMSNHRGDSLLMLAAYNENVAAVRTLLAYGADPNRVNDKGQAPLTGVAFKGHLPIATLLLDAGAALDGPPGTDRTPLMTAAMFDRVDIFELLLKRGADPDRRDGSGLSALDFAQSMKAERIAPALKRWRAKKLGGGTADLAGDAP